MDKYELMIEADYNDGDYTMKISTLTEAELKELLPIFEVIKACKDRHNWPSFEGGDVKELYPEFFIDNDEGYCLYDVLSERMPYAEYGVHTITKIEYYKLPEKVKIL